MSERNSDRDLTSAIQELATALEGGLIHHPTGAELQAFVARDLPPSEREKLEEHLALCRACARKVLDLLELPKRVPLPDDEVLPEGDLAAEWQRFQESVASAAAQASRRRAFMALAAALLLTVLGLVAWGLRKDPDSLPRTDVYLADLYPVGQARSTEKPILIPSWAGKVLLVLNLDALETESSYQVEILTAARRQIWSRPNVTRQDTAVIIEVSRSLLTEDRYWIHLVGPQGRLAGEYEVHVEPSAGR